VIARAAILLALFGALGCSSQNAYTYPKSVADRYVITTGDTDRPYRSLGYVQLSRQGADLFGFLSIVDADLQKMFGEELLEELERSGADGIINVSFRERQWTTAERVLFALPPFFLVPLPTKVELRGELIHFEEARVGKAEAQPSIASPSRE
jgi:hypothetical protein